MEKSNTYLANKKNAEQGKAVLKAFEEETKRPMEEQQNLLFKILKDNQDTEFGKAHGFSEIRSIEDYQKKVPVAVYDNFAPYLERMMRGEKNILTSYRYDHFNETSGTIGLPKVVPLTDEQTKIFAKYNSALISGLLAEHVSDEWMEGRVFTTTSGSYRTLENGFTVGCASTKMADYIKGGKNRI